MYNDPGVKQWCAFALSDMTTPINSTGEKFRINMPGCVILAVAVSLATPCTAGTFTVDLESGGTSVLSTLITVDAGERSSRTAATPPVINPAQQSQTNGWDMTIDVDDVGDSLAVGAILEMFVRWINTTAT